MIKIKDGEVRPGVYGPCSDISLIWRDMRSGFGYKLLGVITKALLRLNLKGRVDMNNINGKGKYKYGGG